MLGVPCRHCFWSWDANLDVAGIDEEIANDISDRD